MRTFQVVCFVLFAFLIGGCHPARSARVLDTDYEELKREYLQVQSDTFTALDEPMLCLGFAGEIGTFGCRLQVVRIQLEDEVILGIVHKHEYPSVKPGREVRGRLVFVSDKVLDKAAPYFP